MKKKWLGCCTGLLLVLGCGPAQPFVQNLKKQPDPVKPSERRLEGDSLLEAHSLGLRIAHESSLGVTVIEPTVLSPEEIVFSQPLPQGAEGLCFVWPQSQGPHSIVRGALLHQGHRSFQREPIQLASTHSTHWVSIHFDPLHQLWFVPLSSLLDQEKASQPARRMARTQVFVLELIRANQHISHFGISLRVQDQSASGRLGSGGF
ncbi:MAG: hypothetical protein ACO3A2_03505 [Bdellovibrionia bacterium]